MDGSDWCRLNRASTSADTPACVDMKQHLATHHQLRRFAAQTRALTEAIQEDAGRALHAYTEAIRRE